jgi:hypothetical protein
VTFLPILPWGAWLGISIGGLLVIAAAIVGICYCKGRGKQTAAPTPESETLLGEQTDDIEVKEQFDGTLFGEELLVKNVPEIKIPGAEADLLNVKIHQDTSVG